MGLEEAKQILAQKSINTTSHKPLTLSKCNNCGTKRKLYYCDRHPEVNFCKRCLMKTNNRGHGNKLFVARCKSLKNDCNFFPFNWSMGYDIALSEDDEDLQT